MWADLLTAAELDAMLTSYEQEVQNQLLMQREQARRGATRPARTAREAVLWNAINENIAEGYEQELRWVRNLRQVLQ